MKVGAAQRETERSDHSDGVPGAAWLLPARIGAAPPTSDVRWLNASSSQRRAMAQRLATGGRLAIASSDGRATGDGRVNWVLMECVFLKVWGRCDFVFFFFVVWFFKNLERRIYQKNSILIVRF